MKVLYFGAVWCPSCLVMRPIWRKVAKEFDFELIEYDYDFDEEEVKKYLVEDKLPTCIVIKKEEELTRIIGEKKLDKLTEIIEKLTQGE